MKTENILSPRESLDVITDAISKTRENIRENSFGFLLWGWLIAIASFAFFLLQYTSFEYYFVPFPVVTAIGIVTTTIFFKRKNQASTQTYAAYFMNKMWVVLGVCFVLVVFMNVSQGNLPFTYTLLIAGIGTLVSGWVMRFRPLIIGGILFLISTMVSIYITDEFKPLLHGVAILCGYLVPGYLLKNSNR